MADLIISKLAEAVVSQAIDTISELLANESSSLIGVKGRVKSLQTELRRMQCFLKDAERKQEQDERVRNWVEEVKDVAHEIEDVIEIYISKVSSSYFKAFHLVKLRNEINSIQAKIDDIFKSADRYKIDFASTGEGTSSVADEIQRNLRRLCQDDDDDDLISLEENMKALKAQLMKVEDRLRIVSVVGMGGLGKTTLANKVYKQNDVKQHFDCCVWVFISQQYVLKDVLYKILFQIVTPRELARVKDFDEDGLADVVNRSLKEKRYLIVLDDIWEIKAWDRIKRVFPNKKAGSKILFTTRNREVALCADPESSPIEPPLLTFDESWQLLQRKAFQRENFHDQHCLLLELEKLGKDMAKKCGGLPLAIVILGGLLNTRKSIEEWNEVKGNLNAYLNKVQSGQQYEGVQGILALSYHDLPYYLKPCFLFLGCFLEDREICQKTLIQLWISEGFVQTPNTGEEKEIILEYKAEQYLRQLMDRYMIQVRKKNQSGFGGVKTYHMHDLMRDFCVYKAREEKFFQIIQDDQKMNLTEVGSSIYGCNTTNYLFPQSSYSCQL